MIDFPTIRSALLAWWDDIGLTAGSPATFVQIPAQMENEPDSFLNPKINAAAIMNIRSVRKIGDDEVRREDRVVAGRPVLIPTSAGVRVLTVSVRVEAMHQKIGWSAWWFCERARTRLGLPSVRARLREAGLAVVDTGPLIDLPYPFDQRQRARASFDAFFGCIAAETVAEADAIDTIGSVEIRSNLLTRPDGEPTDPQLDMTVSEND